MTYCSNCGKVVPSGAKFCPNCAAPVAQPIGGAEQSASWQPRSAVSRPQGARFLMLLDFVVGTAFSVFGALVTASAHTAFALTFGSIIVVLGLLTIEVGYGLRKARPWAWLLGLWAAVVYIVLGILLVATVLGLPMVVFGVLTVYCLTRAELKRYLGKILPDSNTGTDLGSGRELS